MCFYAIKSDIYLHKNLISNEKHWVMSTYSLTYYNQQPPAVVNYAQTLLLLYTIWRVLVCTIPYGFLVHIWMDMGYVGMRMIGRPTTISKDVKYIKCIVFQTYSYFQPKTLKSHFMKQNRDTLSSNKSPLKCCNALF